MQLDRSPHGGIEPLVVEVELGRFDRSQSVERGHCGVRPDVARVSATAPTTGAARRASATTPSPNSSASHRRSPREGHRRARCRALTPRRPRSGRCRTWPARQPRSAASAPARASTQPWVRTAWLSVCVPAITTTPSQSAVASSHRGRLHRHHRLPHQSSAQVHPYHCPSGPRQPPRPARSAPPSSDTSRPGWSAWRPGGMAPRLGIGAFGTDSGIPTCVRRPGPRAPRRAGSCCSASRVGQDLLPDGVLERRAVALDSSSPRRPEPGVGVGRTSSRAPPAAASPTGCGELAERVVAELRVVPAVVRDVREATRVAQQPRAVTSPPDRRPA